jgi:enamine deaminase RidA (YjgF/YER057c/UK114 family)
MSAEKKLKELGIQLGAPSAPVANYVNAVQTGNLLFLAGKGPGAVRGKLGRELNVDQGYQHARDVGLALLAVMKAELGSLDRVRRVVKVLGMVNGMPEFTDQPKVINGCSDLFVEVFGERGKHARSAVGMGSLPNGIPVEIEVIVEVGAAGAAKKPARPAKKKRR